MGCRVGFGLGSSVIMDGESIGLYVCWDERVRLVCRMFGMNCR